MTEVERVSPAVLFLLGSSSWALFRVDLSCWFRWGKVTAFDGFLIHVARRRRRNAYAASYKNTYSQWYIDRFRSRARLKGIGYLALSSLHTLPHLTRGGPRRFRFPDGISLSPLVLAHFVDCCPLPASTNLRFEKLIACPSTSPCAQSPCTSSRLAQDS